MEMLDTRVPGLVQPKLKKECPLTGAYLAYGRRAGNLNSLLALSSNLHFPRATPRAFESLENFGSNFPLTGPKSCSNAPIPGKLQIAVLTFQ